MVPWRQRGEEEEEGNKGRREEDLIRIFREMKREKVRDHCNPGEPAKKTPKREENEESLTGVRDKVTGMDFVLESRRCGICSQEISRSVNILCATCGMLLCLHCFANGRESGPHRRSDDYYVLDRLHYPVYTVEWTALEELLLIRGTCTSEPT